MTTRPLRRLLAVLACLAAVLFAQPASSSRPDRAAAFGERGSGPASWQAFGAFATNGFRWADVNQEHWARSAVDYVGGTYDWMRDYRRPDEQGRLPFKPDRLESRRLFARALVRAFGAELVPDTAITFDDVAADDRFFAAANIAVSQGWMEVEGQSFLPLEPVTVHTVHRALVYALGLQDVAAGAQALHLRDGTPVPTPAGFGTLLIGMKLGLRYNHGDEALDVLPDTPLPRAEVAWSLYRAASAPTWVHDSLAPFATIELPNLSAKMQAVVAFGVQYVGRPYIWGGDWAEATPSGYCCGYQPQGGFDCSGATWWLMKKSTGDWDNTPPREYEGWELPERSSAQMAAVGERLTWDEIKPGDLLFYDGDGDGVVDHVDVYLGNGWAFDSGSSNAGVTITRVEDTWYEEHFVHARRITG